MRYKYQDRIDNWKMLDKQPQSNYQMFWLTVAFVVIMSLVGAAILILGAGYLPQ